MNKKARILLPMIILCLIVTFSGCGVNFAGQKEESQSTLVGMVGGKTSVRSIATTYTSIGLVTNQDILYLYGTDSYLLNTNKDVYDAWHPIKLMDNVGKNILSPQKIEF